MSNVILLLQKLVHVKKMFLKWSVKSLESFYYFKKLKSINWSAFNRIVTQYVVLSAISCWGIAFVKSYITQATAQVLEAKI